MAADSQKMGRARSGGQRIDDHSFWAGGKSKGSVFPEGAKVKTYDSADGAGSEMDYEDTTEKVKSQQELGVSKIKGHPQRPLHRN